MDTQPRRGRLQIDGVGRRPQRQGPSVKVREAGAESAFTHGEPEVRSGGISRRSMLPRWSAMPTDGPRVCGQHYIRDQGQLLTSGAGRRNWATRYRASLRAGSLGSGPRSPRCMAPTRRSRASRSRHNSCAVYSCERVSMISVSASLPTAHTSGLHEPESAGKNAARDSASRSLSGSSTACRAASNARGASRLARRCSTSLLTPPIMMRTARQPAMTSVNRPPTSSSPPSQSTSHSGRGNAPTTSIPTCTTQMSTENMSSEWFQYPASTRPPQIVSIPMPRARFDQDSPSAPSALITP